MPSISDLSPAQFSDAIKAWNDAVKEDAVFSQTDHASFQVGLEKAILADYHGGGMGLCYWDFRSSFSKMAFPWANDEDRGCTADGDPITCTMP